MQIGQYFRAARRAWIWERNERIGISDADSGLQNLALVRGSDVLSVTPRCH
jgi:hypothetical protein